MATRLTLHPVSAGAARPLSETALAYDRFAAVTASRDAPGDLFDLSGSYADRALWTRLDAMLVRMWTEGRRAIRILDLGCGAGRWLLRLALRARDLGFAAIDGVGIDASPAMIDVACQGLRHGDDPHIGLRFEVGDLLAAVAGEDDGSFDIVLCLNGVLNHLPAQQRAAAAVAMARVCDGEMFVTVASTGGRPSCGLLDLRRARAFRQDHAVDRLAIDLDDGGHIELPSHLFHASELASLFGARVRVVELLGLDLFHARFEDDPRWNACDEDHAARDAELERLEHLCEAMPDMIDAASMILLHGCTRG